MKTNYEYDYIVKHVDKSYMPCFEKLREQLIEAFDKVKKDAQNSKIFPWAKNVLKAFTLFPLDKIRVVILGQDPYIDDRNGIPNAMGLSFSVPSSAKKLPPSLLNIYKELRRSISGFSIPSHGDLTHISKREGILLMNCYLTVIEKRSCSHRNLYENIADDIIKYISKNTKNVSFILLGKYAKSKARCIDKRRHNILIAGHPSPLNTKGDFIKSDIFKMVNDYRIENFLQPVDWTIPEKECEDEYESKYKYYSEKDDKTKLLKSKNKNKQISIIDYFKGSINYEYEEEKVEKVKNICSRDSSDSESV